jgi:hypothetical protein
MNHQNSSDTWVRLITPQRPPMAATKCILHNGRLGGNAVPQRFCSSRLDGGSA